MIKSKVSIALLIVIVFVAGIVGGSVYPQDARAAGQSRLSGGNGTASGELLDELKAKLASAADVHERRDIIEIFNTMSGPDAASAQVLLDFLKDNPGTDIDPGNITEALVKLMIDEQVAQLARDINIYIDTAYNETSPRFFLVRVLVDRINNLDDMTSVLLSLENSNYFDLGYNFQQFMRQAWAFSEPDEAVLWMDRIYDELNPKTRQSFVHAAGANARQLSGADRAAVTGWLWRAQEKEADAAYRCNQLFILYQLGIKKALQVMDGLYAGIISSGERVDLIRIIAGSDLSRQQEAGDNDLIDWLWQVAKNDQSPYCRQESLAVLYTKLGQEEALDQYVRDTDQNGVGVPIEKGWAFQTDWRLLKAAGQKYPQSFLGRGIRAYEEVRRQSYFEIDRPEESFNTVWVPPYGDEEYNPDREIPGWEKFLLEFSRHPAADDAAYRLARCYEIKGRFADAVRTMCQARFLPDGDMRYAADGRLVYILDVKMTYDQLKALTMEELEPALHAFVNYSLAVKEIRRDNYALAAAELEQFLKQAPVWTGDPGAVPWECFNNDKKYDLRGAMEKQLAEVKELASLQARWEESKNPSDLYDLAAAIFHNPLLYYNHLWAGQRQSYNWYGFINTTGHGRAPAEMAVFAREMINYNHSLPYFQQVYQDPSSPTDLKAEALYSSGLSYIGLDEWGEDASFGFNLPEVAKKIVSIYRQFIREYPDSSMADDALLALGAYTGDAAYLQRIFEDYPDSDVLGKVKNLIKDMESPYYRPANQHGWSISFKIMSCGDEAIPREIKEWTAANVQQHFTGSKTLGEWNYLLVAAGENPTAGYSVSVTNISAGPDKLKVYYRVDTPAPGQVTAQVITYPFSLIRVPACGMTVEFIEGNPW